MRNVAYCLTSSCLNDIIVVQPCPHSIAEMAQQSSWIEVCPFSSLLDVLVEMLARCRGEVVTHAIHLDIICDKPPVAHLCKVPRGLQMPTLFSDILGQSAM